LPYALELFFKQKIKIFVKFNKPQIRNLSKISQKNKNKYLLEITSDNIYEKEYLGIFSFIYDYISFSVSAEFFIEETNNQLIKFDEQIKLDILIWWEDKSGAIGHSRFYFKNSFEKLFYNVLENKIEIYK